MATIRNSDKKPRKTVAELREENEKLKALVEEGVRCIVCDTLKTKDKFHMSTDPMNNTGRTCVCKSCLEKIACNGKNNEVTRESLQKALKLVNKPFLEDLYDSSVQESENINTGKTKSNVYSSYIKNVAMINYAQMTWEDSDCFKNTENKKTKKTKNPSVNKMLKDHEGQDTYDSFQKNKADVIKLLDYDPFEKELVSDQPFLYAQLLALLDSSEEANSDMIRTSSAISIARGFLQASKLDDSIAKLMANADHFKENAPTIKSLQDSKQKVMNMITSLAAESCLSLKNNKSSTKGSTSWTGKLKQSEALGLREIELNGFDIATCRGMQQVADVSMEAIIKKLNCDESEYAEIIAKQRKMVASALSKADACEEAARILLRENIDLRDAIKNKKEINEMELVDLNDIVNTYLDTEE